MSTNKCRLYALTGAVAAITATGAWYGAGLNVRQEYNQQRQATISSSTAEKLEQLHLLRQKLVTQREELEAKINQLESKSSGSGSNGSQKKNVTMALKTGESPRG